MTTWVVGYLVASNDEYCGQDEECSVLTNKNDMECKVVHMVEAHVGAKKLWDLIMLGEGL